MAKATIQTLTPIHIGTGIEMHHNIDYLYFATEKVVAKIREHQILDILIGKAALEAGMDAGRQEIDRWVSVLDNKEDLLPVLKKRMPNLTPSDVSDRVITQVGTPSSRKPIREQSVDADGTALLPGSSLKGAIRTALLERMINDDEGKIVKNPQNLKNQKGRFADKTIIEKYFGKDPNHDALRLLQVGDANFGDTVCLHTVVVNEGRDGWKVKPSIEQWVEAIPAKSKTTVRIKMNDVLLKQAAQHKIFPKKKFDPEYKLFAATQEVIKRLPLNELCTQMNEHTIQFLTTEIDFWKNEDSPELIETYIEELERILAICESCGAGEAVLRLGWGTGFLTMTGDWQYNNMEKRDREQLESSLRAKSYEGLLFPKSRRMCENGIPLGFIKINILED